MTKAVQAGDYYLLPFVGKRKDLLVRAKAPHANSGHWHVTYADGRESLVLLSSCTRCAPSVAKRILGQGAASTAA